jgi:hypothetical protein
MVPWVAVQPTATHSVFLKYIYNICFIYLYFYYILYFFIVMDICQLPIGCDVAD